MTRTTSSSISMETFICFVCAKYIHHIIPSSYQEFRWVYLSSLWNITMPLLLLNRFFPLWKNYFHQPITMYQHILFSITGSSHALCPNLDLSTIADSLKSFIFSSNQNKENLLRYLIHLYFWVDSLQFDHGFFTPSIFTILHL